mmetsp:Transcript_28445/g.71614  ORF Transcript_28445/g.71614 Transcript_28445/m.71614 type:complete len:81 (+) Transcript_28445:1605-1847(+)
MERLTQFINPERVSDRPKKDLSRLHPPTRLSLHRVTQRLSRNAHFPRELGWKLQRGKSLLRKLLPSCYPRRLTLLTKLKL